MSGLAFSVRFHRGWQAGLLKCLRLQSMARLFRRLWVGRGENFSQPPVLLPPGRCGRRGARDGWDQTRLGQSRLCIFRLAARAGKACCRAGKLRTITISRGGCLAEQGRHFISASKKTLVFHLSFFHGVM
jgi:hypothetical protein